jgi:hypothetical protein
MHQCLSQSRLYGIPDRLQPIPALPNLPGKWVMRTPVNAMCQTMFHEYLYDIQHRLSTFCNRCHPALATLDRVRQMQVE